MSISAIVSERLPEKRGAALNLLQIIFGLSAASPLLLIWADRSAASWRLAYYGLCAAALGLAPAAALLRPNRAVPADRISLAALAVLYRRPRLWVIAASQALYAFAEVSLLSWAVPYLVGVRGEPITRANMALSAFWVLFALGRLGCSALSTRVSLNRIVVVLTMGSALTLAAVLLVRQGPWPFILVAVSGLFYSGVFGTILAYAGDSYPQYQATVFGLVLAAGSVGAVLGPWLVGSIAESASLSVALAVVALTMLATGVIFVGLGRSRADEGYRSGREQPEGSQVVGGEVV
jgi:fucose permease